MKDKITIYGDEYGKYYSVDFGNGSNNTYRDYYDAVNAISKYYNMSDFFKEESKEEFKYKTVKDLKKLCKDCGFKNYSKLKKDELIKLLE